jgi:hypothetical protein
MAMEIQIMRRTGYAMKIKTPAEAAGIHWPQIGKSRRPPVCVAVGFNRRAEPCAQKNLSFHPAFAQV